MLTLYPPLDDYSACNSVNETTATTMKDGDDDDVLSPELRQNFETMRALIKQDDSKKRKDAPQDDDLQAKKYQVAMKIALAVEDEMSRLRNGIAELEALVAQQEGGGFEAFPSLPPVVPSDDDEVEVYDEVEEADKLDLKMVHGWRELCVYYVFWTLAYCIHTFNVA